MRSLLVIVSVAGLFFAAVAGPLRESADRRRFISRMESAGAKVSVCGLRTRPLTLGLQLLSMIGIAPRLNQLFAINLSGQSITGAELEPLAGRSSVYSLNLANTGLGDVELEAIAPCTSLRQLDLTNTAVTDEGILKLKALRYLARLDVSGTEVSYAALEQLDDHLEGANFAEHHALAELKTMGISAAPVPRMTDDPDPSWQPVLIGGNELMAGMLILYNASLSKGHIKHVSRLRSLQRLEIFNGPVEPGCFDELPLMPNLRTIEILHTGLTDADLIQLTRQTGVKSVRLIGNQQLTDRGVLMLAKLTQLKKLSISVRLGVTPDAIERLRTRLPNAAINEPTP